MYLRPMQLEEGTGQELASPPPVQPIAVEVLHSPWLSVQPPSYCAAMSLNVDGESDLSLIGLVWEMIEICF